MIDQLKHSPVHNYIVPGLTSWLIAKNDKGMVRLFEMTRHQEMAIAPHSHRYDFECVVLEGEVENTLWSKVPYAPDHFSNGNLMVMSSYYSRISRINKSRWNSDLFQISELRYTGDVGGYVKTATVQENYYPTKTTYKKGDTYSMRSSQIHSIRFSKGAKVLFIEGESKSNITTALDPVDSNGNVIPQTDVQSWMFQK